MRQIDVLVNRGVDAFIIAPSEHAEKQIKILQKRSIPVVLIDWYFPKIKTDYVIINNFKAAYQAVEHLIKNGRDKIAMMTYDTGLEHMKERVRGKKQALVDNNIPFDESIMIKSPTRTWRGRVALALENLTIPE